MDWLKEYEQFTKQDWKPTTLPKDEELKFQKWLEKTELFNSIKSDVAKENNIPVNVIDNKRLMNMMLKNSDYDYRGAYKANIKEVIDPYDKKPHMPDSTQDGKMLKSPKHETAWKEFFMKKYRIDPDSIGLSTIEKAKEYSYKQELLNQRKQKRGLIEETM